MKAATSTADWAGDFWSHVDQLPQSEGDRLVRLLLEEADLVEFQSIRRSLLDCVHLTAGDTLIELGAGPASYMELTAARLGDAGEWVCVDLSRTFAAAARKRLKFAACRSRTLICDAKAVDLPDACADAVVADKVFLHIANLAKAVDEMVRLVRLGKWVAACDASADATFVHSSYPDISKRILRHWADIRPTPNAASSAAELFSARGLVDVQRCGIIAMLSDARVPFVPHLLLHWAGRSAKQGAVSQDEAERWVADALGKQESGSFLVAIPLIITSGRKPGPQP